MIPFLDMNARNQPMRDEFLRKIAEVIDSGIFAGGPVVERFEREFAGFCECRHAVGVGNGTEAIWLTLMAMEIGPGDEVVTVPMTFAATVEAIVFAGAKPVFVDIDPQTYTMNPEALERAITPRTKAVIPVHLFGQTAEMEPILDICRRHGLRVIEDAAQAHGAEYHGRRAGSLGDAGCFSFYPGKNLGAFGEAGAIVTDDGELAERLRVLRNHGQTSKNHHSEVGWNSRMDAIQAAILSVKLPGLDAENELRRGHALAYDLEFQGNPAIFPPVSGSGRKHVFHLYAIRVRQRERLLAALDGQDIQYGIHYPVPVHLQDAYRSLGHHPGDFPVSEQCAGEFVSLPIFPEMTSQQISCIVQAVKLSVGRFAAA